MHIPEVKHLEDPESENEARTQAPMRMALRNASAALLGIAMIGIGFAVKAHFDPETRVAWWIWPAVATFAVVVCFVHAFLAAIVGGKRAARFLKVVMVLVLAGMLFALWWSLQPKEGAI